MKIKVVSAGSVKEKYLREAVEEYAKRISRFCELNFVEIKEQTQKEESVNLKNEAADILTAVEGTVIALCVEGKQFSSEEFSQKIEEICLRGQSTISFVIGSSYGLSDKVKERADEKISFSKMTFPHQLMKVILLEQIYRAFTIQNNIRYHK